MRRRPNLSGLPHSTRAQDWEATAFRSIPFYLSWKARQYDFQTRFIELAGEVNNSLPAHVVDRLATGLNLQGKPLKDANILLVGVAYKPNVDDVRESPALAIIQLLHRKLARVHYHDPLVPRLHSRHLEHEMSSSELSAESIKAADALVIVTNHRTVDYEMIVRNARLIVFQMSGMKSRNEWVVVMNASELPMEKLDDRQRG